MNGETPNPYAPPPPTAGPPAAEKKSLGCFFWGCISVIVVGVVGALATLGAGYLGLKALRDNYTEAQPVALPALVLEEQARKDVRSRFDDFRQSLDKGAASEALTLDTDEVNALIATSDPENPLAEALRVEIVDDHIKGQLSLPMDRLKLPGFGGRYLNGTADLRATLRDGNLEIRIDSLSVKGKALPEEFMKGIRSENFARNAMENPKTRATIGRLESIEIADGKIILVPRTGEAGDGPAPEEGIQVPAGADDPTPPEESRI